MSTSHEGSFWPRVPVGDDFDLELILKEVIERARAEASEASLLAEVLAADLADEISDVVRFSASTEVSRAAEMFREFARWITADWSVVSRRISVKECELGLGMKGVSPSGRDALSRQRRLAVRMLAAMFVVDPQMVKGESIRSAALKLGVTAALLDHEVLAFSDAFGIRGRSQKCTESRAVYACAQLGNKNRTGGPRADDIFSPVASDLFPEGEGKQKNSDDDSEHNTNDDDDND